MSSIKQNAMDVEFSRLLELDINVSSVQVSIFAKIAKNKLLMNTIWLKWKKLKKNQKSKKNFQDGNLGVKDFIQDSCHLHHSKWVREHKCLNSPILAHHLSCILQAIQLQVFWFQTKKNKKINLVILDLKLLKNVSKCPNYLEDNQRITRNS